MGISPTVVGSTHVAWVFTFTDDSGKVADLSALTVTTAFSIVFSGPSRFTGTGTWSWPAGGTSGADGKVQYKPSSADLAAAGTYQIQVTATFAGADPLITDAQPLVIKAAL